MCRTSMLQSDSFLFSMRNLSMSRASFSQQPMAKHRVFHVVHRYNQITDICVLWFSLWRLKKDLKLQKTKTKKNQTVNISKTTYVSSHINMRKYAMTETMEMPWKEGKKMLPVHCRTQRGFNAWHNLMFKFGNNTRKRRFHPNLPKFKGPNLVCYESTCQLMRSKAFCLVMHIVKPASKTCFFNLAET